MSNLPSHSYLSVLSLIAALMVALFGGCCVYPLQNDRGASFSRSFYGATTHPNETIRIQARSEEGEWKTISETRTGMIPEVGWAGLEYYIWYQSGLYIPGSFWSDPHGIGIRQAEVRMVDSKDQTLHTYEKSWNFDDLWSNPLDVWRIKGNRSDGLRLLQHHSF